MLPSINDWEKVISLTGISNNDRIIIYDNSDVISSCRCWYNFIYFGHDPKLVQVLDGGLKKWKSEKKPITSDTTKIKVSNYIAKEKEELVKNKNQIDQNILNKKFELVDARSKGRFEGKDPEPRKGVRSGSIKNSFCSSLGSICFASLTRGIKLIMSSPTDVTVNLLSFSFMILSSLQKKRIISNELSSPMCGVLSIQSSTRILFAPASPLVFFLISTSILFI